MTHIMTHMTAFDFFTSDDPRTARPMATDNCVVSDLRHSATGIVIDVDESVVVGVRPGNNMTFTLEELYLHTGCNIVQMIQLNDDLQMWMDEEGKFRGPPKLPNTLATAIASSVLLPGDYVVGKVLICANERTT